MLAVKEGKKRITITLDNEELDYLRYLAEALEVTPSEYLNSLLRRRRKRGI